MSELTAEGKILGFGVGLESLDHALEWARHGSLAGLQVAFGILDPEAAVAVIPTAVTNSVPVIARGAFASGLLVRPSDGDQAWLRPGQAERRAAVHTAATDLGVAPLQLATWFVNTTPGVQTLLVGTTSEEHLQQAVWFAETPPPQGAAKWLDRVARVGAAEADRPATGQQS
jgi:aryl-alcohol dehydrogenase-like predicted oxidoreductase